MQGGQFSLQKGICDAVFLFSDLWIPLIMEDLKQRISLYHCVRKDAFVRNRICLKRFWK